jgi:hypothetical protein
VELTWASVLFFASFSVLLGVYLGLSAARGGWSTVGSVGGAGLVGMLGASVSSLTHCGLGSFGVLLALAGVSASTLAWFGRFEPVLIPLGYALIAAGVIARASALARTVSPGPGASLAHATPPTRDPSLATREEGGAS